MIYNLYLEANKQAHIVRLGENTHALTQYLTINTNGRDELFTLDKSVKLVSSTCMNDDKQVYINDITLDNRTITVSFGDTRSSNLKFPKGCTRIRKDNKTIVFENTEGGQYYCSYNVVFKYHSYIGKVIVHCVPSEDLYDVVLDFGSEASQMLIRHNADGAGVVPQPLFSNILRHYYESKIGVQKRVYDQQDDDQELFRSIFFKKENADMGNEFELEEPNSKDGFLGFITKRNCNSGERIPNVKISFLTGQQLDRTDRTRLHVGIIMRFFHEAIKRIGEMQQEANRKSVYIAIRFTVLLPNVMPQSSVSSLIQKLQGLANDNVFLGKFSDAVKIPYVQVRSCSESDASFLDRMNEVGLRAGDMCLTIDIGKGTTDFSITKRIDANNATSLFRSGFVGAGNAVSYAIFDNCIEQMVGKSKKKEVIKKVFDAEPALLFDLDNIIEEIKHNWGGKVSSKSALSEISSSVSVEAILDQIRNAKSISDDSTSGSINRMSEVIADNILKRLPDLKINKIIISGRAFRFKVLKEVLIKKLQEKFKSVKCVYDENSAKRGCLIGASSNIRLSLSSSMVGMPIILDASKLDLTNHKELLKKIAKSAYPELSASSKNNSKTNNSKTINKVFEDVKNVLSSMVSPLSELFKNDDAGCYRDNQTSTLNGVRELMSHGKEYPEINSNSLICISGRYYVPADQYTIDNKHCPYQIYFDGDEFYLRHNEGSHKLIEAAMLGVQDLCFESLFPYSRLLYNDDLNIPD